MISQVLTQYGAWHIADAQELLLPSLVLSLLPELILKVNNGFGFPLDLWVDE